MTKRLSISDLRCITIAGVGLLGGSIGLAVRAAGLKCHRVGYVRSPLSGRAAVDCDAVDEATLDASQALASADLVILATPLGIFPQLLRDVRQHARPRALITDVGSTKRAPQCWASQCLGRRLRFIGSHPMAGSERTGVEFARADLFQGATCFVCPGTGRADAGTRLLQEFWEAIGGRVTVLSPAVHDRTVARVSHVPHLVAGGLIHLAGTDQMLNRAGPGLRDATRIASGNPVMWRDILTSNRDEIVAGLDEMQEILARIRTLLAEGKDAEAEAWMQQAAAQRNAWLQRIMARGQAGE
jgi:prephenate dehydrogenase